MGFAKYFEDNVELVVERFESRHSVKQSDNTFRSVPIAPPATWTRDTVYDAMIQECIRALDWAGTKTYKDKVLLCRDCGKPFVFSAGWQKKIEAKGWNEPKRCRSCKCINDLIHAMRL